MVQVSFGSRYTIPSVVKVCGNFLFFEDLVIMFLILINKLVIISLLLCNQDGKETSWP